MGNNYTIRLFARPSWLSGMARTLDLGGTFTAFNTHPTGREADTAALAADWHAVGDDLMEAAREWAEEQGVGQA